MTKQQFGRMILLEEYLRQFLTGPKTIKELTTIQAQPANMINCLLKQGYVIKVGRGKYAWKAILRSDNLKSVAKLVSESWNSQNVYHSSKELSSYSAKELLNALNAKGVKFGWDFANSKLILL